MKNVVRKTLCAALVMGLSFSLIACGGSSGDKETAKSDSKESKTEEKKTEPPKIEEIDWSVDEGVVDGERTVVLSLANNSKLALAGFEISFIEKDDITVEQKDAFFKDIKKKLDVSDDDMDELKEREISMHAETGRVVLPGDTISNINCYYYDGYFYMKDMSHYELVTPDIAQISYVDGDLIRKEYYDFRSQKYSMDEDTEEAQYWTKGALKDVVPKPEVPVLKEDGRDDDECFMFDAYGMTMDDFNAYVDQIKELGFTEDPAEHEGFYSADNADGYNVYIYYEDDNYNMSVTVEAPEKEEEKEAKSEEEEKEEAKTDEDTEKVDESEVSADFKKAMDEYEAFFDDYAKFMKKYYESDDVAGMLSDYNDWMQKYSDMYGKLLALDTSDLSADDYAYYYEVLGRIEKKIAEAY